MNQKNKLLVLLIIAVLLLTACRGKEPVDNSLEENPINAVDDDAVKSVEQEMEQYPDAQAVLEQKFQAEMDQDFELAYNQFWRESIDAFGLSYNDVYPSKDYNENNFEQVDFEVKSYIDFINPFDVEARKYLVDLKFYWYGEYIEESYNFIMVFVQGEGWKIAYKGYLSTEDLGFMESRVQFSDESQDDLGSVVVNTAKFAPRQLVQTAYTTYLKLDILLNPSRNKTPHMFSTSKSKPEQVTWIVLEDDNQRHEVKLEYSEIKTNYNHETLTTNTKMLINCQEVIIPSLDSLDISVEDYIVTFDEHFATYDIKLMEDGEFLNKQISSRRSFTRYNEEVFLPNFSDEVLKSDVSSIIAEGNDYVNSTGNRINNAHMVEKDRIIYMWYDYALYSKNMDSGDMKKVSDLNPEHLNLYGDYLFFIDCSHGNTVVRMDLKTQEVVEVLDGYRFEEIQIIDDYLYYKIENNVGRVSVDMKGEIEPVVSGLIGYWNVQGDYLYYLNFPNDYTENQKICRVEMSTGKKELLYEEIYNEWPHIDDIRKMLVDENHVYFVGELLYGSVFRMNHDGTELTELIESDEKITQFHMDDDGYYVDDNRYNLYRILKDSDEFKVETLIEKTKFYRLSIVDGKVFYRDYDENIYWINK